MKNKQTPYFDNEYISTHLKLDELILALNSAYASNQIHTAPKSKTPFGQKEENTVMIMPAHDEHFIGIKTLIIIPDNPTRNLPSNQGNYNLYDAITGKLLCTMAAEQLTTIRTACTSALAASKLARKKSESLLVIGNGAISYDMIRAHDYVGSYSTIYFWGRNEAKSKMVVDLLPKAIQEKCIVLSSIDEVIRQVDVISMATSATTPIVTQDQIQSGQHIDLVGSFTPNMKEIDPHLFGRTSLYVDDLEYTPQKAGEIVEARQLEIIDLSDIIGDLTMMCNHDFLRESDSEITVFKSSGMALQDLVSAQILYKNWLKHEA